MRIKNPKIIVTIPLFEPGKYIHELVKTISSSQYQYLVWSNSQLSPELVAELSNLKNVIFKNNSENLGLSFFLKYSCEYAYLNNFDVVLNLDQDTWVDDGIVSRLVQYIKNNELPDNIIQLSLLGNTEELFQEHIAINSGAVFFLNNLNKLGFHSQKYFVDGVDYKFCLDVSQSDYIICSIKFNGINHSVNQGHKKKYFFSYKPVSFDRFCSIVSAYRRLLVEAFLIKNSSLFFFFLKDLIKQSINFIKNII